MLTGQGEAIDRAARDRFEAIKESSGSYPNKHDFVLVMGEDGKPKRVSTNLYINDDRPLLVPWDNEEAMSATLEALASESIMDRAIGLKSVARSISVMWGGDKLSELARAAAPLHRKYRQELLGRATP